MRQKLIFALLALMLCVGAFSVPVWAYVPPDADTGTPQTESAIPATTGRTITPDGSGAVVDRLSSKDGKEFYTIKTPDENVFYLVIDIERSGDNVYFLNAVTEDDLMSLAQKKDNGKGTSTSAIPTQNTEPKDTEPSPSPEPEATPPAKSGGNGSLIWLILAVAAVGGVGYYMKIVRPKQQAVYDEPEDDDTDESEDDSQDEPENREELRDDNEGYEPESEDE